MQLAEIKQKLLILPICPKYFAQSIDCITK